MHQPLRPAVPAEEFIAAMGLAATAVSVVTTDGAGGRFGLTVSAISSVSADPPLILACINRKSRAISGMDTNRLFAVSLLSAENQDYAETFSGRSADSRPFDFDAHSWRFGATGVPLVTGATAAFECELDVAHDAGTHRIYIGRVIAAHRGEAEPLIYCNRKYRRIGTEARTKR